MQIQPYGTTSVKAIGAIEALIALMLLFGDRLGGILLNVYLITFTLASYGPAMTKGREGILSVLPQLLQMCMLIGFSLIFMDTHYVKKQPRPI